jgi:hypothetical protein
MDETNDNRIASLRAEARYSSERLQLYRARRYSGRPVSPRKMRELERASEGAEARLQRALEAARARD